MTSNLVRSHSRRQYVSIMARGESLEWLPGLVVRIMTPAAGARPKSVILGPIEMVKSGSDARDLERVDQDLRSACITRTSEWEATKWGWVAWVAFDDEWTEIFPRMASAEPVGGLTLGSRP